PGTSEWAAGYDGSSSRGTRPSGEVTITSWTAAGFPHASIASMNRRCVRDSAYGLRAEHGRSTRTRGEGGFRYEDATNRWNRTTSGRVSAEGLYALTAPSATGKWSSWNS